uniref:Putative secreted protein n=1 Tax=Anopheles darlingi TaxID=43151 RepID=A0A2M4DLI6_ANODA
MTTKKIYESSRRSRWILIAQHLLPVANAWSVWCLPSSHSLVALNWVFKQQQGPSSPLESSLQEKKRKNKKGLLRTEKGRSY